MKSIDSIKLGLVSIVAVVGIIIMTLLSTYNINGYYGFAARGKGNIGLTPGLSFEAESGASQGFLIGQDPKASEQQYVYSPDGTGSVSYSFNVEKSGLYKISTKVSTTSPYAQHNSFYVQLNAQEKVLVDAQNSAENFKWNTVSALTKDVWLLEPGTHTITIEAIESDVKIDSVALALVASQCADNDKDGYGKPANELCQYNAVDCNDRDQNINPGATESCENRKDDNCDGHVNEGCPNCESGDSQSCNTGQPGICSQGTQSCSNGQWGSCVQDNQPTTEICGNGIDEDCNGSDLSCGPTCGDGTCDVGESCNTCVADCGACPTSGLARSFSANPADANTTITVTITKTLQPGQSTLLTEEYVPAGFTILNAGSGIATGNTIRWAELTGAQSGTYTYTVRAPLAPGDYTFSGVYSINGGATLNIVGSTLMTVQGAPICSNGQTQSCTTGLQGVCAAGTQTCTNNVWGSCVQNVQPSNEICGNGIDEDCNGLDTMCPQNVTYGINVLVQAEVGVNNGFTIQNGYVFTGTDEANSISYAFNIPTAGQYVIMTGIVNADPGTDSFYVGADGFNAAGNNSYIFDTIDGSGTINNTVRLRGPNGNYSWWQYDPMIYNLNAGTHTFTFFGREKDTKMDYLMLKTYSAPACTNGQTQSCTTGLQGVCAAGTQTCSNNVWGSCVQNVQPSTEICGNGIDEDCNGADLQCAGGNLSRSFSSDPANTNSAITVTITKTLQPGQSTLLTEEYVPAGFTILNTGTGTATGNTIRWAELTGAQSGTYTYTVQTPTTAGAYAFSGSYSINGGAVNNIVGDTSLAVQGNVTCQNGQTQSCTTGLLGVCAAGTQTCTNNVWGSCVQNVQPSTEICGNGIDEDCNGADLTCQNVTSSLSRGFSSNPVNSNTTINVTITKTLLAGQSTLLTEEYVPAGFTVVNSGTGTATGNTIRWAELTGAQSGTYTYTVRTPVAPGNYTFSGVYSINGGATVNIVGSTLMTVQGAPVCSNGQTQNCSTGQQGACSIGTRTCSNNQWGSCVAPTPTIEVCNNNIDEDCDGVLNNGCAGFCDTDGDAHNQQLLLWCIIYGPIDDCDDNNANVYPGATEICGNGIDEDCSGADLTCPNTPPIVSISNPANGSTFNMSSNITIVALASDPNGSISKVEFYVTGLLLGSDTTFPYSYTWTNIGPTGNQNLVARAYDNLNATTDSNPVRITIVQPEYCGNGICAASESCTSCSVDCGSCSVALSRSFPESIINVNTNVTITITKNLQPGQTTLLTEEYVPAGFTILNAGTGTATGNTIRWAELTGATSGIYTYVVRTPSTAGNYNFSGLYSINGGATVNIGGTTLMTVQGVSVCSNGQTQSCNTGLQGVCSAGTQTCTNNVWGSCVQNVQPSNEICGNGIDEDCNGLDTLCPQNVTYGINAIVQAEVGVNNGFTIQNGVVFTSVDEANSISYAFNVPTAGQYVVMTGIVNADPGTDSFYVGADGFNAAGNDSYTFDTIDATGVINNTVRLRGPNGNYSWWQYDPMVYNFTVGTHTITFYGRESNTKMDYLMLKTYNGSVIICSNGQTQSCTTGLQGVCAAGTQTCTNNVWGSCVQNVQPSTEICGNGIDEDCNGVDLVCAAGGNLSRGFSSNPVNSNTTINVTITKTLLAGQTTLLTEEYVPAGFTVVNSGTGTATGNTIRWAELTGAQSGTYTYTVRSPVAPGNYTFSGVYSINGGATVNIVGSTLLTVQGAPVCSNGQTQSCTTGLLGVCAAGTQTCTNNVWGSCVQNVQPSTEICGNGIDEDCNGIAEACANTPPSVFAGIDQTIMLPNTASLSGVATDDGLPNPPAATTVRWTRTSGPGTVTFGNQNIANTTASFSTNGTYVLRLTANDSILTAYDELTVYVNQNSPPTVSITSPLTGTSYVYPSYVSINVTASDINGSISRVNFYANAILIGTDNSAPYYYTWMNATIGNHTLTARAYDAFNASTLSSPVIISIVEPFVCSTGQTQNCSTGLLGICAAGTQTCTNNAWGSCVAPSPQTEICGNGIDEDCNGADLTCPIALSRSFSANPVAGNATLIVNITKTLQPGQSTLLTEEYVPAGFTILNTGTGTATGNTIRWAELTGAQSGTYTYTVRTPTVPALYNFSGLYAINGGATVSIGGAAQLTVQGIFVCSTGQTQNCSTGLQGVCAAGTQTCTNNAWGSCVQNVQPSAEICGNGIDEDCNGADLQCNAAPVVNAGIDRIVTLPNALSLSGVATDDGLPNPPAATTVRWTRTSGPGTVTFSNQNSVNTNATFSTNGTYVLRLTANDSILTAYDELNVVVSPQPVNQLPTVSIISPANGTNYLYPSYISINVTASDSDGNVSKVEFYANGILLSTDTLSPYYYTWMNATVGTHTLTARAFDNQNGTRISAPVIVGVVQPVCQNGQTQACSTGLLGVCSAGTMTCSNNNWGSCVQNVQPSTEICGNGIDEDCNGADLTCQANGLSRSFPESIIIRNSTISVTITKVLLPGQSTLLTEEYVPAGFTIVSAGTGSATGNTIRWAELIGATSGTYVYTVRTPNTVGTYSFNGMYSINGGAETQIGGSTQLTVQ